MVGATAVEIKRKALEEGMLTLRMSGLEKIKSGHHHHRGSAPGDRALSSAEAASGSQGPRP